MEARGQPLGSIISFYHVGLWDPIPVIRSEGRRKASLSAKLSQPTLLLNLRKKMKKKHNEGVAKLQLNVLCKNILVPIASFEVLHKDYKKGIRAKGPPS